MEITGLKNIIPALQSAINEMPVIKKDAQNAYLKNKYATYLKLTREVRPILAKNSLFFIQKLNDGGVETIIFHTSGEFITSGVLKVPVEQSKGISLAQSLGISTTYAKRYQLESLLGISTEDDTDGQYGDNTGLEQKSTASKPTTTAATKAPAADDGKAWITDKLVAQAIEKINAGESQIIEKCRERYKISKENYSKLIEAKKAYDALPVTAAEEVPELPAAENVNPDDLPF
jgi:hypothetical protein